MSKVVACEDSDSDSENERRLPKEGITLDGVLWRHSTKWADSKDLGAIGTRRMPRLL